MDDKSIRIPPYNNVGTLFLAILTFVANRKNLRLQSEYQIYARMIEARLKLETSEPLSKWQEKVHSMQTDWLL